MLKVNNSKYFLLSCGIFSKLNEFWYLQDNKHNSYLQNKHNHNLYNNPISDASCVCTTFPGITQKYTNLRHISLTRTDHDKCFLKIFSLKKTLDYFWQYFGKSARNQSSKVVFWKDCLTSQLTGFYMHRRMQKKLGNNIFSWGSGQLYSIPAKFYWFVLFCNF